MAYLGSLNAYDSGGMSSLDSDVKAKIIEMGLHRDGSRWNLPDDVVDERRRVFWEAHTADVFQVRIYLDSIDADSFRRLAFPDRKLAEILTLMLTNVQKFTTGESVRYQVSN